MRDPSNRLNIVTPFRCEYWPVRMAARLGVQIEFVAKTLVSFAPSCARRSRFGVRFTRDPYAPMACAAWSSVMMNRMFGRATRAPCGRATAGSSASVASVAASAPMHRRADRTVVIVLVSRVECAPVWGRSSSTTSEEPSQRQPEAEHGKAFLEEIELRRAYEAESLV